MRFGITVIEEKMGIQGLFHFLRKYEQIVDITNYVLNKNVALDIFCFIHRSKGSIQYIKEQLAPLHLAKSITAVFDGSPTEERSKANEGVRNRNANMKETIKILRESLNEKNGLSLQNRAYLLKHIEDLEFQSWTPSPKFIREVKELLEEMNIRVVSAEKGIEADTVLLSIEDSVIISNDSDLLIHGSHVLRPDGFNCRLYVKKKILEQLQMNQEQWEVFIHICKTMNHTDCEIAFSLIKIYKDIEVIKEKFSHLW